MKKRVCLPGISVLLAAVFCLLLLVGCGGKGTTPPTDTNPTESPESSAEPTSETKPSPAGLLLVADGKPARVVTPFNAETAVTDAAKSISKLLEKVSGQNVTVTDDSGSYDADTVEILIGLTAYPESAAVADSVPYGGWAVAVRGNKAVVFSHMEDGYSAAVKKLSLQLYAQQGAKNVTVAADYREAGTVNETLNAVPVLAGATPDAVYVTGAKETCWQLAFTGRRAEDFDRFRAATTEAGYQVWAENEIDGNRFVTYVNDTYTLNAMWLPALSRINVSAEKLTDTALPEKESENRYIPGVCDTTVTQLGQWFGYPEGFNKQSFQPGWDKWINGLAHVIRLTDGSFLVIDGGHDRAISEELLYNTLVKQAPDPENIVIAAWIFTHAHNDHTGAFLLFDHPNVTVERFLLHLPSENVKSTDGDGGQVRAVAARVAEKYPNAKVTTVHPGQVFTLRNARITMLWSLDLFYPRTFDFFNESSLVFSVELEGHRLMYLGDLGPKSNTTLLKIYASSLKSEIVQTAHHGFQGGTYSTYSAIQPKYVFWNTGRTDHIMDLNGNDYFSHNDGIVKWVAADTVTVVTLKKDRNPTAKVYASKEAYLKTHII